MKKIAVFPGSFDPITRGHVSIIRRALPLFDEIIIAVGVNSSKVNMFTLEKRKQWIEEVFRSEQKVNVDDYQGLTVEYCKKKGANFILRGLRNVSDFEFERNIAQMNHAMDRGVETVFLVSDSEDAAINSTIIRDIVRNGGDVTSFVPEEVKI